MSDRYGTEGEDFRNIKKKNTKDKLNSQNSSKIKNKKSNLNQKDISNIFEGSNSRKNSNPKNSENPSKKNYDKTKANREKLIKNARDRKSIEFGAVSDVLELPHMSNVDNLSSIELKSMTTLDLNSTHEDRTFIEDMHFGSSSGTPKAKSSCNVDPELLSQSRFIKSNHDLCSLEGTIERTPSPFVAERSKKLNQRNHSVASSLSDAQQQQDIFSPKPFFTKESLSAGMNLNTAFDYAKKSLHCSQSSYESSIRGDVDSIPKHIKEKFKKLNKYMKKLQEKRLGMDITLERFEEINEIFKSAKDILNKLQSFIRTKSADTDDGNDNIWATFYENDHSNYVYDEYHSKLKKLLMVYSEKLKEVLYLTKYNFTIGTENHEDIKKAICLAKKITHSLGDFFDARHKLKESERDELDAEVIDLSDKQLDLMKRMIAFIKQYQDKYVFIIDNLDPEKVEKNGLIEFVFKIETLEILYKGLRHVLYSSIECIKNDDITRTIFTRFSNLVNNAVTSIIKLHNHILETLDLKLTDEMIICNIWLIPLPLVCYRLACNISNKLECISNDNAEDKEMYLNTMNNFKSSFYDLSISSMTWMSRLLSKDIHSCATSTIQRFFDEIILLRTFLIKYGDGGSSPNHHALELEGASECDYKYEKFKQTFLTFIDQNLHLKNLLDQKIANSTRSTEVNEENLNLSSTNLSRFPSTKRNSSEMTLMAHPVDSAFNSDDSVVAANFKPLGEHRIISLTSQLSSQASNMVSSDEIKPIPEESERILSNELNESIMSQSMTAFGNTSTPFCNCSSDIGFPDYSFGAEERGFDIMEDTDVVDDAHSIGELNMHTNNGLIDLNKANDSKCEVESEMVKVESLEFRKVNIEDIQVLEPLGKGSYGSVYDARYHGFPVAVKILNRKDGEVIRRELHKEMSMQRKLLHPNIIGVYGTVEEIRTREGMFPGIVMEKCSLCSLKKLILKARRLRAYKEETIGLGKNSLGERTEPEKILYKSWHCRIRIACDIVAGLSYIHDRNLVHRDLTSNNVVLTLGHGNRPIVAKLCDFALSRYAPDAGIEKSIKFPNSPMYSAPEILNVHKYTSKADIYSFGVLLWEILTLEDPMSIPYTNVNDPTVKLLLISKDRKLDKQILPLPENSDPGILNELFCSLKQLIRICWNKKPEHRPTSDEIRTYLEKVLRYMEQDM